MTTTPEPVWFVTDHHHPPRRLHLKGCEHLTGDRPDYTEDWHEPVGDERHLPHCQHCDQRAKKMS
ncbi:hypothetical protein [Kribbella sp. NPDC049227]|uniref:hypothetical protein n=1 Tax=Kribbella sp. NPDC049227 TaxID=3364113 RepID=UPI0037147474